MAGAREAAKRRGRGSEAARAATPLLLAAAAASRVASSGGKGWLVTGSVGRRRGVVVLGV